MDACRKIKFHTPAQTAAAIVAIIGMGAALMALAVIC